MSEVEHNFDRRHTDLRVDSLATRMTVLERHVFEVLTPAVEDSKRELEENTKLTTRTNVLLEGTDDVQGMRGKVEDMHDVFTTARNAIRIVGRLGDWAVRTAEFSAKLSKPLFWTALLLGSIWGYFSTGEWHWPKWMP